MTFLTLQGPPIQRHHTKCYQKSVELASLRFPYTSFVSIIRGPGETHQILNCSDQAELEPSRLLSLGYEVQIYPSQGVLCTQLVHCNHISFTTAEPHCQFVSGVRPARKAHRKTAFLATPIVHQSVQHGDGLKVGLWSLSCPKNVPACELTRNSA